MEKHLTCGAKLFICHRLEEKRAQDNNRSTEEGWWIRSQGTWAWRGYGPASLDSEQL